MNCYIRPAAESDLPVVYRFICLLEEKKFDFTAFGYLFHTNICNKDYCYLVAESGGNIAGFISCHVQNLLHHCGSVAEIQELYVDENHRQQGIGGLLVNYLEKWLEERQCPLFEVTAQNKRLQTHRFYEGLGFERTHKKFVKQLR